MDHIPRDLLKKSKSTLTETQEMSRKIVVDVTLHVTLSILYKLGKVFPCLLFVVRTTYFPSRLDVVRLEKYNLLVRKKEKRLLPFKKVLKVPQTFYLYVSLSDILFITTTKVFRLHSLIGKIDSLSIMEVSQCTDRLGRLVRNEIRKDYERRRDKTDVIRRENQVTCILHTLGDMSNTTVHKVRSDGTW